MSVRIAIATVLVLSAVVTVAIGASLAPSSTAATDPPVFITQQQTLTLQHDAFDIDVDPARNVLYVPVPARGEVHVVSMATLEILRTYDYPGKGPRAVDLSLDGTRLFIAFVSAGSVGIQNLDDDGFVEVVVGGPNGTGNNITYDVLEAKPNRLFVTASPSSSGISYLAMVKLDEANEVSRVTSGGIIRAQPVLAASPSQQYLYVGEGFSPNSLYKFDITTDTAPKVLEDNHGDVSGTDIVEVSADGSRIFLRSGQVLRSDTFVQAGALASGPPRVDAPRNITYVARPGFLSGYNSTTFAELRRYVTSCTATKFDVSPDGATFFMINGPTLCKVDQLDVTATPTFTPTATRTPTPTRTATPIATATSIPARCADLDLDGIVTATDNQISLRAIQRAVTDPWFDLDRNGRVDYGDLAASLRQRGRAC